MKPRLLLFLCFCFYIDIKLIAQVAGPNNPNSFSNALIPGFSQQWINIANVQSEDEAYASFGNLPETAGSHTDYLQVTNFGFTIPVGTIIDGIKVEVNCSDPNSRTSDYSVRIVKTGAIAGAEKASATPYPAADNYITYGSATDLWGETWDYKFISDNQFGVAIAAQRNSGDDVITAGQVNNIRITVYYTFITLPVTLTSFTATMQSRSVHLNWKTSSENNLYNYNVERSADGRNFNLLTSIHAQNLPLAGYNYIDITPLRGVSYYRLNIAGAGGYQKYSQVVSVKNNQEYSVTIFPSRWQKEKPLHITNNNSEKLTVHFFNANGLLIAAEVTDTNLVPAESLVNSQGLIYYKITDHKMNVVGIGHLLVR